MGHMHLIMLQWLSKSVITSWANSAVSVYSQPIPTVRKVHQLISLIPCLNLQPYMFLLCSCGAQAETSGKSSSLCNGTVFSPALLSYDKTSTKLLCRYMECLKFKRCLEHTSHFSRVFQCGKYRVSPCWCGTAADTTAGQGVHLEFYGCLSSGKHNHLAIGTKYTPVKNFSWVQHTKNRGVNGFIKTNMTEPSNVEL